MTRTLLSTALVALLSVTAAQAAGSVPGSDTRTRSGHAAQDQAVAAGVYGAAAPAGVRTFGYAADTGSRGLVPGSDFFNDAASDRAARSVATGQNERSLNDALSIDRRLVPGSDSF